MDKSLLKYNVADLALSINEARNSLHMAIEQMHKKNTYGEDHYKEQCGYWSKRAVEAVQALGLDPEEICPRQSEWAANMDKS